MQASELTLLSAHVPFGPSVGRWPTTRDPQVGPVAWARELDLRARVAEAQARQQEPARTSRPARLVRSRPWRVPPVAYAGVCILGAFVIGWILPFLSTRTP